MRVLVCGSRYFDEAWAPDPDGAYEILDEKLRLVHNIYNNEARISCIISGKAKGADTLAERWAEEWKIPFEGYPADWEKYGKAAGPIRNKQMLDEGKPDLVVAFRGPNSRGTQNMIDQAKKAGIPVEIIDI